MKAKIRKTGEIVEIICYSGSVMRRSDVADSVSYIDSKGDEQFNVRGLNFYWDFEPIMMARKTSTGNSAGMNWQK